MNSENPFEDLESLFSTDPDLLYEMLLLGPLTWLYDARKKTQVEEWMSYSNLLIDKFAIHSSTFFHLSKGIIEHRKSGQKRVNGYDLFTVNTTIRVIIETYTAFNHIFVEPTSSEEKYFRFLLWKLDGLYQEKKYDIHPGDFEEADEVLQKRQEEVERTISQIDSSEFIKSIHPEDIPKVYNPNKKRVNWKFLLRSGRVRPLQIIELVKHCCRTRAFFNSYKHSSIHTHSNFPAVEDFRQKRGKLISSEYTAPNIRMAIFLTCLMIFDISRIDINAKKQLDILPKNISLFILGVSNSILKTEVNL